MKIEDINVVKLLGYILPYNWQRECDIVKRDGRVLIVHRKLAVERVNDPELLFAWKEKFVWKESFLRYSKGPKQGYFWDTYGDDMDSPELAIIALSKAPPPVQYDQPVYEPYEKFEFCGVEDEYFTQEVPSVQKK